MAYLVVPGVSKVLLQTSQLALETFVLLSKGEPLLLKVITIKRHQKREQQMLRQVKKKITTHIDRVGHIVVVISQVSASAHISVVQVLLVLRVVVALLQFDL